MADRRLEILVYLLVAALLAYTFLYLLPRAELWRECGTSGGTGLFLAVAHGSPTAEECRGVRYG